MEFDVAGDMTGWVGLAYAAITAVAGWIYQWGRGLRKANEELAEKLMVERDARKEQFQTLELKLAAGYHNKDDLDDLLDLKLKPLFGMLHDIKDRLDRNEGRGNGRNA